MNKQSQRILSDRAAQQLLLKYSVPPAVAAHGEAVGQCALHLAQQSGIQTNEALLLNACRVHDLAKGQQNHAHAGAQILIREGYLDATRLVAGHHDLPEDADTETCLLYLADKLVQGVQRVSLDERFRASRKKCRTPDAIQAWQKRYDDALFIIQILQIKLDD